MLFQTTILDHNLKLIMNNISICITQYHKYQHFQFKYTLFVINARKPIQLSIPYNSPKIRSKIKIELLQTDHSNQIQLAGIIVVYLYWYKYTYKYKYHIKYYCSRTNNNLLFCYWNTSELHSPQHLHSYDYHMTFFALLRHQSNCIRGPFILCSVLAAYAFQPNS